MAVRVEQLGKRYRLGGTSDRYKTLRESIVGLLGGPRGSRPGGCEFWALKDVSFDVNYGQVLGIIGRNGAGKSTLLKILSRITEPTTGSALVDGRVGALLEVGTGFHPELTGRENVYLNGAILGMSQADIRRNFDRIVEFAEVERFLDTPVKRYSSGMYMRLAFSVAAHLEPEVLIVDEVLAVGDVEFQKKCLGKMGEVASEGRTVLFVSHNLDAMRALCTRALLLGDGEVVALGSPDAIAARYVRTMGSGAASYDLRSRIDRTGSGEIRCVSLAIQDSAGQAVPALESGARAIFVVDLDAAGRPPARDLSFFLAVATQMGTPLFLLSNLFSGERIETNDRRSRLTCHLARLPLAAGSYRVDLGVKLGEANLDHVIGAGTFDVVGADFFGTGQTPPAQFPILLDSRWSSTSSA